MTAACGLYQPGHRAHYIPVLKLAPSRPQHSGHARVEGTDAAAVPNLVDGQVSGSNVECVRFTADDGTAFGPFFHHDMAAITAALDRTARQATLVERLWLLRVDIPGDQSRTVFSLSDVPIGPCDSTAYPDREWDMRRE